jgi:hypothetical protein
MSDSRSNIPNIQKDPQSPTCDCVKDPFADLPPELQPKNKSWKTGFRQVSCPSCGLKYWTNIEGDLCMDCQKKRIQNSSTEKQM